MDSGTEIFAKLSLWIDPAPRDGPGQMACDEALLAAAEGSVLRIFRWRRPWVSAGYFSCMATAARVRPDLPLCRRWTGGGTVVHEDDFTFALVVPRGEKLAAARPAESYLQIHRALAGALCSLGMRAALAGNEQPAGEECFAGPVRHDVMVEGCKIAGGAQRRTRSGLLHQGSVQGAVISCRELAPVLARALSASVATWGPSERFEDRVAALEKEKYANREFLRGRSPRDFTGPVLS